MTRSKIFIALAAVLGLLLVGRDLYADEFAVLQADDSGPIPPASLPDILKALPRPPDQPASLFQQATQEHSNESPLPDRYFEEDPLLDTPDMPKSGWFTALDLQLAAPHVFQFLYNGVTAGSRAPDFVNLPNRGLDWTLAPRLEIGYQLPSGFGGFSIAYRNVSSSGNFSSSFLGPDGAANLTSQLSVHIVDLDYVTKQFTQSDKWEMRWRAGVRTTVVFYDSILNQSVGEASSGTGILQQQASNFYAGVGPHVGVELRRHFVGVPGLSFLGAADFGGVIGRVKQGFNETAQDPLSPSGVSFGQDMISSSQTVQMLNVRAGLDYRPQNYPNFNCFLGYQYDYWWGVGRFSLQPGSRGDLSISGFVLRLTYNY